MLSLSETLQYSGRWGRFCHRWQLSLRKHMLENISSKESRCVCCSVEEFFGWVFCIRAQKTDAASSFYWCRIYPKSFCELFIASVFVRRWSCSLSLLSCFSIFPSRVVSCFFLFCLPFSSWVSMVFSPFVGFVELTSTMAKSSSLSLVLWLKLSTLHTVWHVPLPTARSWLSQWGSYGFPCFLVHWYAVRSPYYLVIFQFLSGWLCILGVVLFFFECQWYIFVFLIILTFLFGYFSIDVDLICKFEKLSMHMNIMIFDKVSLQVL